MYFDKLLDFPILLLLFLHTLLLCHILLFECWIFFNTIRVSNSLDTDQAWKNVQPDLGPNWLQRSSAELPLAGKELNTEQLLDTIFWLKPWLKSISFGSNFFQLAKVLTTTNSEPRQALSLRTKNYTTYKDTYTLKLEYNEQSNQLSLPRQDGCQTRKDTKTLTKSESQ